MNYTDYSQYDKNTINKLREIQKQVDEEKEKEKVDEEKLTKLRFAQLMQGLSLQMPNFEW